jgi:hypothetical protein
LRDRWFFGVVNPFAFFHPVPDEISLSGAASDLVEFTAQDGLSFKGTDEDDGDTY